MTIVNAAAAAEAVSLTSESDQLRFSFLDPTDLIGATLCSWITSGGDDLQATGAGFAYAGGEPTAGLAAAISLDLSNDSPNAPDVTFSAITRQVGISVVSNARLAVLAETPGDFLSELLSLDDTMTGSAFGDTFKAGGGADTLNMGGGDDTAYGGAGDDVLNGAGGADSLFGDAGSDVLSGGAEDDRLNGGTGVDAMYGGAGDDVYVVDVTGDYVAETVADGGVDLVDATLFGDFSMYTLPAEVENLIIGGGGNYVTGRGNGLANVITEGDVDDICSLFGAGGNDTLYGRDHLYGGAGADLMVGGQGPTTFAVDNPLDVVQDTGLDLGDLVDSTVDYTLPDSIEDLRLEGGGAIDGTGNAKDNVVYGSNAANILRGLGGSDRLHGDSGQDTLYGGAGVDLLAGGGDEDSIYGGAGADAIDGDSSADVLYGGSGLDRFIYKSIYYDSLDGQRDVIMDFEGPGSGTGDLVDLEVLDAISGVVGNQAFTFFVAPAPTIAGALWLANAPRGETIVYGNTDSDIAPELAIRIADGLTTAAQYTAADFIL